MDELLAFIERYAPGYRGLIQGAHEWRIDDLEKAFGQPLPKFYRKFASVMGVNGGPLLAHVDTYEPTKVADLYRFASVEMPPRRFLFVFGDPALDDEHYWLDLETPSEDGDCQVVKMPFGDEAWEASLSRYYVSLREMLFAWAMENICLPTFPYQAEYFVNSARTTTEGSSDVEELAGKFERLGFKRLSYPRHCLVLERKDASVEFIRKPTETGIWFSIGGRDHKEFQRLRALAEELKDVKKI